MTNDSRSLPAICDSHPCRLHAAFRKDHRHVGKMLWSLSMLCGLIIGSPCYAADEPPSLASAEEAFADPTIDRRLYRTREERREAGMQHEIAPWLTLSGLAEAEFARSDYGIETGSDDDSADEETLTLQLAADIEVSAQTAVELVLEYDSEIDDLLVDEAVLIVEAGPWELAVGRQYTPFGAYISHFVSGPLVEFGETRSNRMLSLVYSPDDRVDVSLSAYRGAARRVGNDARRWDWVTAIEVEAGEHWSMGLSYQSDLADADSRLLEDADNRYTRRVAGLGGYLLWTGERFAVAMEAVGALRAFDELDHDRNRPQAWNLEVAHFIDAFNLELALRVEGSRELEDEPYRQYGLALTWRFARHAALTAEYLHGRFKGQLASNEDDLPYRDIDQIGALLSVGF